MDLLESIRNSFSDSYEEARDRFLKAAKALFAGGAIAATSDDLGDIDYQGNWLFDPRGNKMQEIHGYRYFWMRLKKHMFSKIPKSLKSLNSYYPNPKNELKFN